MYVNLSYLHFHHVLLNQECLGLRFGPEDRVALIGQEIHSVQEIRDLLSVLKVLGLLEYLAVLAVQHLLEVPHLL